MPSTSCWLWKPWLFQLFQLCLQTEHDQAQRWPDPGQPQRISLMAVPLGPPCCVAGDTLKGPRGLVPTSAHPQMPDPKLSREKKSQSLQEPKPPSCPAPQSHVQTKPRAAPCGWGTEGRTDTLLVAGVLTRAARSLTQAACVEGHSEPQNIGLEPPPRLALCWPTMGQLLIKQR